MESIPNTPNTLALRYSSPQMREIWSPQNKVVAERRLWVEILKVQKDLGMDISSKDISAYEKFIEKVDLDSIAEREAELGHDVKARIEEFSALAGREKIHIGLTSRDITENIEQQFILSSLQLISERALACLATLTNLAEQNKSVQMVARTHNMPSQITTLGRRFALLGEELLLGCEGLEKFMRDYKFRGIKGAVGTQSDLLEIFDGEEKKVAEFENRIFKYLAPQKNAEENFAFTGQVYPRSQDLAFAHCLVQLIACPLSFALDLRLLAGQGLANEGQPDGRVGSTAMPHKSNPSICERISGLGVLVKGYMGMLVEISGNQWNEGDVSCSVVRRVALPDICFATEGLLLAFSGVLEGIQIDASAMQREATQQLPFLSSSRLLISAVNAGMGREQAHKIIREQSRLASFDLQSFPDALSLDESLDEHPLVQRLAELEDFRLDKHAIIQTIEKEPVWGRAEAQTDRFADKAKSFLKSY